MTSSNALSILSKYGISKDELKKRNKEQSKIIEVDFHEINRNVLIHTNNQEYYKSILSLLNDEFDERDKRKIETIINRISSKKDIEIDLIVYENELINKIRKNKPEIFDQLGTVHDNTLNDTLDLIIRNFNKALETGGSLISQFDKVIMIAVSKKVKYASVFGEIGKKLEIGVAPNIQDLIYASNYFTVGKTEPKQKDLSQVIMSEILLRRMSEWEAKCRVLSVKERSYLADFAYGLKKKNDFHDKNLKRHLTKLLENGFII
jgi:hypothetical protein